MPFFSHLNEKSDITDILFRSPKRYGTMNKFTHGLLRGKSELTVAERELIATFVSANNACNYCSKIHNAVAERYGVDANLLEDLMKDIPSAAVSEKMKPILEFSKKLTLTPSRMIAADAEKVYQAGWSEQTLEDVIGITALFNYYNRILDGHGIKGNATIFEEGSAILKKNGYNIPNIVAKFLYWKRNRK